MEGTRLVLLYFSSLIIGIASKDMTMTVEEGFPITLPCLSTDEDDDYDERSWYDGRFDDDDDDDDDNEQAQERDILFRQNENGDIDIEKGKDRGMSINEGNFSLDIKAANLTDNGTYTCHVKSKKKGSETWDNLDLKLYILPNITMNDPKENHVYIEGDQLKATCAIDRIYPGINQTDFIMNWVGSSEIATIRGNNDSSYRCLVDIQKKLSMEDHGKDVICIVTPKVGPTVPAVRRTLNVEYGAKGRPELRVSESEPIPGEIVIFTCDKGNTTANPLDHVKWTQDGEDVDDYDPFEYIIDNVSYEHNGTYKCQLGNEHGFSNVSNSIVLNVNYNALYAPRGTPGLSVSTSEVIEGGLVVFNCSLDGIDSYLSVYLVNWTKNGEPLTEMPWPNETTVEATLDKDNTGNYSCSVGNKIGYSEFSEPVNVNVLFGPSGPKPVLSVNVAKEINSGDYVTFTCITEGIKSNPGLTIVKWTKNGEDCQWPKTTFNHTPQVTTTGNYSCMVGNVINSNDTYSNTSEQVELQVKAAEGSSLFTKGMVGGIVGGLVVITLVIVIVITVIVLRKRRKAKSNDQNSTGNLGSSTTSSPSSEHEYANVDMSRKEPVLNYAYLDFPNQSRAPSPTLLKTMATDGTDDAPTDYVEVDWEKTETQRV